MKFSRNGSGTSHPFISVLFEDKNAAKEFGNGVCGNTFIATFEEEGDSNDCKVDEHTIRVLNMKNFETNWRGDWFARELPQAIEIYCKKHNTTEISISAACFPKQYQSKKAII